MIKGPPLKNILLVVASCPSCCFICRLKRTRGDCRQFHLINLNVRSAEFPAIARRIKLP